MKKKNSASSPGRYPRASETELDGKTAARAAHISYGILAALVIARGILPFVSNMWLWSLNLQRFVPQVPGWGLWALAALPLVPGLSRHRLSRPLAAKRKHTANASTRTLPFRGSAWVWALASAVAVWLAPDRLHFVGDFAMRLGAARLQIPTEGAFPQAFPLDLFLHKNVPGFFMTSWGIEPLVTERLLGAVEAGAFALLAATFVRGLGLRGVAEAAATAIVVCGGYLSMFTGYGKAFKELCVLTAAIGAFGILVAREGRGLLPLGLAAAIGFTLHRSALVFLAPLAVAWWIWLKTFRQPGAWRRPAVAAAVLLPLVTLAFMAPRMAAVIGSVDRIHVVPSGSEPGHVLAAIFHPIHLVDVANVAIQLSPLAACIPGIALWLVPPLRRRRDLWILIALALPLAAMMLVVHPRQGVFRDWDVFAPGGVALSLVCAWMFSEIVKAAPHFTWIGVAAALGALAPSAQVLINQCDIDQGLLRIEAFLDEPPPRGLEERASALTYLGRTLANLERYDASAGAFARAAELGPSPMVLFELATAEMRRGNLPAAQANYRQVVAKVPNWYEAWMGLAVVSFELGDLALAWQTAERAQFLRPGDTSARNLLHAIARAQSARPPVDSR